MENKIISKRISKKELLCYLIMFLATITIIYYNMAISIKYPAVYLQYNQNILYLIGKMIKNGKVPYIDVIDHKGIYVLLIHYIAALLGENNNIGLFVIGIIFNFITAVYIYKILIIVARTIPYMSKEQNNVKNETKKVNEKQQDVLNNSFNNTLTIDNNIIKTFALLASTLYVILQSLYSISYATLQSETFITLGIVVSIYFFIYDVINDKWLIGSNKYNLKHTLIYGIVFSYILFIKPNYNLYFLGIAIIILISCIKDGKIKNIFKHIIYGVIGMIIGAMPGIIYAICNHNLKEMFYYTFFVNAIYSNAPYIGLNTKIESILWTLSQFIHIYLVVFIGLLFLSIISAILYKNKITFTTFISLTPLSFLVIISTLVSARNYSYYLMVLLPFIVLIIFGVLITIFYGVNKLSGILKIIKYVFALVVVTTFLLSTVYISKKYGSDLMIKNGKDHLKVADSVKDVYKENVYGNRKELLILGSEIYLYDYIGVLPQFRYFAVPMIGYEYYSEPYLETIKYIDSRKADILVVGLGASLSEFYNHTNLVDAVNRNYKLISNTYGRQVFKLR